MYIETAVPGHAFCDHAVSWGNVVVFIFGSHARYKGTRARVAAVAAIAVAFVGLQTPSQASTAKPARAAATAKSATFAPACTAAKKDQFSCFALRRTGIPSTKGLMRAAATAPAGYGPSDLLSAYNLPADGGAGMTVALVDAYDDPNAENDLAVYREQYGLPACTTADGCFRKVDESGGTNYPTPDSSWSQEISLDLDMVSAIAPDAHILLVEATTAAMDDLGASVDEAVALGADYVSNSYGSSYTSTPGSGETASETTTLDAYYNHPGVGIVASAGDEGYGVAYPAASQYVTSVGGTSLTQDSGTTRGWTESAWSGTGSGCSLYEPKPAFQTDTGCSQRAVADVSAVADPNTPVAVYDSYETGGGWLEFGGTSVASPIIASVYADAGAPTAGSYPNSYPYLDRSALNDVTSGSNGTCSPSYLCTAGAGYDGPTGLGTPDGLAAFQGGPHGEVEGTISDSSGAPIAGAQVSVGSYSVTTGANGGYQVVVPAGTYDVTVGAYGYASQTFSAVAVDNGATVAENVTLAAVPRVTVSGVVTDGSGQGWPLYASIKVEGASGGPVFSNPKTGAYSVQLPINAAYTLETTPVETGYQVTTTKLSVGTSDLTQNITAAVDASACVASGYALNQHGVSQTFDTTSVPTGWTVTNNGTGAGWVFDDPGSRGNETGGTGGFAIVDSLHDGDTATEDTYLTSPVADLSGMSAPSISFDTWYFGYGSTADVDVSLDGGSTWSSVWSESGTDFLGQSVQIPLPQAAGDSTVQVRFHYTGESSLWWEIDNVLLGDTTCDPLPGGLVVGQVTDENTGAALNGVTVSENGAPTVSATSAATADPSLKGAFYWLFSPTAGSVSLTATKPPYANGTATITVPNAGLVESDFSLAAGRISVSPASVGKTLDWDGTAGQKITLTNTGTAPATVNVGQYQGGFTQQSVRAVNAPVERVAGPAGSGDAALAAKKDAAKAKPQETVAPAAGTAWQETADFPTAIQDNIAQYYNGELYSGFGYNGVSDSNSLYSYDANSGAWTKRASADDTREDPSSGFIDGKLYVVGGWGASGSPDASMEIYDPASNTWSQGTSSPAPYAASGSAVIGSTLYVVGGCGASTCGTTDVYAFNASTDAWSQLAAYPEPTAWVSCGDIQSKLYCAGGNDGGETGSADAYVYDPGSNTWTQLASLPAGVWAAASTTADGQLLMQDGVVGNGVITNQGYTYDPSTNAWSALPNSNVSVYRAAGAVGFYTVGGSENGFGVPVSTTEVLAGYDLGPSSDVPWLSESSTTLTIAPGASASFTATLNAGDPSVTQPGVYTASLDLAANTPYSIPSIPVSLTVKPPASWGKITGVVQYTNSAGQLVPMAGATVQVDTWAADYTLHTDADGTYGLWLDRRNNPLTVIAAQNGFQPAVKTVTVKAGKTITVTFTLLVD